MRIKCFPVILIVALAFFLRIPSVTASTFSVPGFQETIITTNLSNPTVLVSAPDGRIFVGEKNGVVRVIKNDVLLATPFVSFNNVFDGGEAGLLGIAFDPQYASNRYIYFLYSRTGSPVVQRVVRVMADANNPDVAGSGEVVIIDNLVADSEFHNGGAIHFGPDGKLYISKGEGYLNAATAQQLGSYNGKILRINKDGTIPTDNPFYNTAGAKKEIWALGLRNPYRFAFDPVSGRMFINDVGDQGAEEIDDGLAGRNYGWPQCEGNCFTPNPSFTDPFYFYNHSLGRSITGGVFYRGNQFPAEYSGDYLYVDFEVGWLRKIDQTTKIVTLIAENMGHPVDLTVSPNGALYYVNFHEHLVGKITYPGGTTSPLPSASPSASPTNQAPQATFTSPAVNQLYSAGDTITYAATATDLEDGTLPASAFSWTVMLHHDTHSHPFLGPLTNQQGGTFTIPKVSEVSPNVWYRIYLTVTDSKGLQTLVTRDVLPRKVTMTFTTNPAGLPYELDGQPKTALLTIDGVVGVTRNVNAPSPFINGGKSYTFKSWSDGGAQFHFFDTPAQNTTYTVSYRQQFADFNLDGKVNAADMQQVLSQWNITPAAIDTNQDGKVNAFDASQAILEWNP